MTQIRNKHCQKCGHPLSPISDYFDTLFDGVGERGSSFMNLDRVDYHVAHDKETGRVIVFEFKNPGEKSNKGQRLTLRGLVGISPQIEAWVLRRRVDGRIEFFDIRRSKNIEIIEPQECRRRFQCWWRCRDWWTTQPDRFNENDDRWIVESDERRLGFQR